MWLENRAIHLTRNRRKWQEISEKLLWLLTSIFSGGVSFKKVAKNIKRLGVTSCLLLILLTGCSSAQASSNESSRISRLESEIFTLRSRFNQLESQVSRLSRSVQPQPEILIREPEEVSPTPPQNRRRPQDPTLKEQFDNLATLVIELKEQVNAIEERLDRLESQLVP